MLQSLFKALAFTLIGSILVFLDIWGFVLTIALGGIAIFWLGIVHLFRVKISGVICIVIGNIITASCIIALLLLPAYFPFDIWWFGENIGFFSFLGIVVIIGGIFSLIKTLFIELIKLLKK